MGRLGSGAAPGPGAQAGLGRQRPLFEIFKFFPDRHAVFLSGTLSDDAARNARRLN